MSEKEPTEGSAIQPIGFLVTLSSDWRINRVSANIADYFGAAPDELLGQPVTNLFSQSAIHSLRNRLALLRGPFATERLFSVPLTDATAHYDVAIHMSGDQTVIEAEPNHHDHHERESTGTVRGMIAQLGEVDTVADFFEVAANQVRALTGYDRVTIHRLGPDGGDEVVGEVMRKVIGPAMGEPSASLSVHPPTRRSLVSFIADVDAEPVPVVSRYVRRSRPADLSRSALLAASPADVEQLRSMGVGAALSIAIVTGGQLWGQITCHHHAPSCPSFERRSAVEWYAIMLAMQIEIRELKAKLDQ